MQGRYVFLVLTLILCISIGIVGCKKGEDVEYQKGYAEAQTAFETAGNTKVDNSLNKDNLGVKVEQKKTTEKSTTSAQTSSDSSTVSGKESSAVAYKYVVNTETMYIHKVGCTQVDLKLPTNQIWKGTLEDAEKAGYTRDPDCLDY